MSFLTTLMNAFMPKRRKRRKKKRSKAVRSGGGFQPSAEGMSTKVLVANLFGSGGKEISERLAGMLGSENNLSTYQVAKTIKQNLRLGVLERLLVANEEGAGLLKEEGGDLLCWGEMEDMGTVARLHYLCRSEGGEAAGGVFGLADTLDLPVPLPENTGDVVRAVTVAAALPVASGGRKALFEKLKQHLKEAEKWLASDSGKTVPPEVRASLHAAMGNAHATALRFGDKKACAAAIKHYETADNMIDATDEPLAWALVQTHWGAVMEAEAKIKKDPAFMEQAVARYLKVTEGLARDAHGHDWALAHVRCAMARYKLASMVPEKTATYLKEAAQSFDEALTVYDKTLMPLKWAEAMNHYGVVQMALGGHGAGNAMLQQSITTFRKALEVRKRDIWPGLWAQTANNLGAACVALAKRTKEEHLVNEAAECFEGAIEVYRTQPGQKKRVAVIVNNLDKVRQLQGKQAA